MSTPRDEAIAREAAEKITVPMHHNYERNVKIILSAIKEATEPLRKAAQILADRCPREQCYDEWRALDAALVECSFCDAGFPINERGDHIPTQKLGMIPVTPCKSRAAQPQEWELVSDGDEDMIAIIREAKSKRTIAANLPAMAGTLIIAAHNATLK